MFLRIIKPRTAPFTVLLIANVYSDRSMNSLVFLEMKVRESGMLRFCSRVLGKKTLNRSALEVIMRVRLSASPSFKYPSSNSLFILYVLNTMYQLVFKFRKIRPFLYFNGVQGHVLEQGNDFFLRF